MERYISYLGKEVEAAENDIMISPSRTRHRGRHKPEVNEEKYSNVTESTPIYALGGNLECKRRDI